MKEGNPFGPFWQNFNINFDESVTHEEILWSTHKYNIEEWHRRYILSSSLLVIFGVVFMPDGEENVDFQGFDEKTFLEMSGKSRWFKNWGEGKSQHAKKLRNLYLYDHTNVGLNLDIQSVQLSSSKSKEFNRFEYPRGSQNILVGYSRCFDFEKKMDILHTWVVRTISGETQYRQIFV